MMLLQQMKVSGYFEADIGAKAQYIRFEFVWSSSPMEGT
jgi:hypothetical protein